MKLTIKNLGSIKNNSQSIDLSKKFLIFVGRNNSGKTYVSQLLWTIFNEDKIETFAQNNLELVENSQITETNQFEITSEFIDRILKSYAFFLEQELEQYPGNIFIEFDYKISDLKNKEFQATFKVRAGEEKSINYLEMKKDRQSLIFKLEDKELPEEFYDFVPRNIFGQDIIRAKKTVLMTSIIIMLIQNNKYETLFLPAIRHFLPQFYSYIYDVDRKRREQIINQLLNLMETRNEKPNLSEIQEFNIRKRPYTESMNQVIENLYSLNNNPKINNKTFYLNLVQQLEEIMGGTVQYLRQEEVSLIEFNFKIDSLDNSFPMFFASSSVNQLTLIYLYCKYWAAEQNNFLIMDEPEENLHPENQIKLLNILLTFVSERDNRVLIATHSPMLANAINNYIYLDTLKNQYKVNVEKIIEKYNLKYVDSSINISKDNVGVYFFKGDKIIDYESDDYGIYFRNFREVEDNLDKSLRILAEEIYIEEDKLDNG
ncbi:MAG: AAA family ATPase [Cyanobacteria bacterium SBLK]|nr:AAA family ATPase [Cyanobacteria bacterium SBLK]